MLVKNTNVQTTPEILKRKLGAEYLVPVTITAFDNGVCKAGSPIGADGTVQNGASAVGILLYDVYEQNPNGSLVKAFAVINTANAEANTGLTIDSAVKTALPMVIFE
jgi:hypothetical protein